MIPKGHLQVQPHAGLAHVHRHELIFVQDGLDPGFHRGFLGVPGKILLGKESRGGVGGLLAADPEGGRRGQVKAQLPRGRGGRMA
ncbi:hypothetical protein CSW50_14580 [Thermus scotoductus]|uniref:Uncharacterized protein n=1 Tax=Thermus scotoductus TaxID=37636 RepID=A0A430QV36_THESC|nr:hypothetical protein CSW50_14580 [Thermus scotoductus]